MSGLHLGTNFNVSSTRGYAAVTWCSLVGACISWRCLFYRVHIKRERKLHI